MGQTRINKDEIKTEHRINRSNPYLVFSQSYHIIIIAGDGLEKNENRGFPDFYLVMFGENIFHARMPNDLNVFDTYTAKSFCNNRRGFFRVLNNNIHTRRFLFGYRVFSIMGIEGRSISAEKDGALVHQRLANSIKHLLASPVIGGFLHFS